MQKNRGKSAPSSVINKKLRLYSDFTIIYLFVLFVINGMIKYYSIFFTGGPMLLLSVAGTVDITQEIPLPWLIVFAVVLLVVLFVANRVLSNLFIPKNGESEPPVWAYYNRKNKRKK